MDLNRAMLIGNVTRDPEVRTTPTGQQVCSFSIATNSQWTDQSGVKQTKAEYHNIVAWGKLAEICGQYLNKGKKIYLEGRLQTREWEGQDGAKRRTTEIVAENMIMLDRGGAPMGGAPASSPAMSSGSYTPPQVASPKPASPAADMLDRGVGDQEIRIEDIPF